MINEYDIEDMSDSIADHETEHKTVKPSPMYNMCSYIDMDIYLDNYSFSFSMETN